MIEITRNNQKVNLNCFTFNGGEESVSLQIPKIVSSEYIDIKVVLDSSSEVMRLAMVVDAVRRLYKPRYLSLNMTYIPYARQDRVCNEGEALSIKVFCDMINSMGFDRVVVSNPHSDVAPALLNNCIISKSWEISLTHLLSSRYSSKNTVLVSPDAGALKKTYELSSMAEESFEVIVANKHRDTTTGNITNTSFSGDVTGKICVICDDIIDGGWTFIKLAEALKNAGARKVILAVTHGIFSKGLGVLIEHIDEVISSDSFHSKEIFDGNRNSIKTTLIRL